VTTAFVALDGSQREVTIRGGNGHWCSIHLERQSTKGKALVHDAQRRPCGFTCDIDASAVRLWVPEGASGIQIRLEPGGVQDFDSAQDEDHAALTVTLRGAGGSMRPCTLSASRSVQPRSTARRALTGSNLARRDIAGRMSDESDDSGGRRERRGVAT